MKFKKINKFIVKAANITQIVLLLFFRLNWGWQFFQTGQGKLLHHEKIAAFFAVLHLPLPGITAWFVGLIECVGGLFLMTGLFTRITGLILTGNMIVAYLSVVDDRQKVFNFFNDQTPFLQADPFFYLLTALLAFAFAGGPISLDTLIEKWVKSRKNKSFPQE